MNIEGWIASVINLSSVPCFGVCGNILTVSHNTPICTIFLQTAVLVLLTVWSMLFSLLLYMIGLLVSVVSAALHVLVHHIEETVAIALLFYIIVMNWGISGLVSLLTFQTKHLPATDNGSRSVLSCQSVMKVPKCFYCLNCPEFDELILRKIVRIVATRCQIFRLKCTKFNFGWGSAPDPAGGSLQCSPRPPSCI